MALAVVLKDCSKQVTIQQTNNDNGNLGNLDDGKLNRLIDALEKGEVSEESIRACEIRETPDQNEIGANTSVDPEPSPNASDKQGTEVSG